tara:strand:+ start:104 stop:241 length:138 start_codon:yes stop_codon:yes gene_type:complete
MINEIDFSMGLAVGLIMGLLISMALDKWHIWKEELRNETKELRKK